MGSSLPNQDNLPFADYDEHWVQEFEQMRSSLFDATAGQVTQIEHIGATSVPRMPARPVIDLLAGLDDPGAAEQAEPLIVGLNYRELERPDIDGRVRWFVRPRGGTTTHSVFLVEKGTAFWLDALRFRDALRDSQRHAWRYASYRRLLREIFAEDAAAYEEAKLTFIRSLLGR